MIPNAPFGSLKFSSPFELCRLLSVLTQSHVPESWRTARLLDRTYDLLTPSGLGLALAFYRQHCVHMTLSSVSEAGFLLPEHPPRGKCDPYNMATLSRYATQYAEVHPWTSSSWMELRKRKNLIILPAGFDNVLRSLKTENQKAVVLKKPEDIQPDWFIDNLSSVVLFSPAEFAGTLRWRGANNYSLLLQQVARGVELITLAGPQNDQDWRKSVDMLRDLCEETVSQRPTLQSRIRCLLPLRSQLEAIGTGFRSATYEHGKMFTESTAKRFWTTTLTQQSAFLKLEPFQRTYENKFSQRPAWTPSNHQSSWRGKQRRGVPHLKAQRLPLANHQLQKIGEELLRMVPHQRTGSHTRPSGGRGRGTKGSFKRA